jgi:hypothetical protein
MRLIKQIIIITILLNLIPALSAIENDQLSQIAKALATDVAKSFPSHSGMVLSCRENEGVFINLGIKNRIKVGDRFQVYSQDNTVRNEKGEFEGYEGELLATIEVERMEDDYSFCRILETHNPRKIDYMDLLHYIQPSRKLYISPFEGTYGGQLSEQVKQRLNEIDYILICADSSSADYVLTGELFERNHKLDARLLLSGPDNQSLKIEKRFIFMQNEIPRVTNQEGYTVYTLPEKTLDFTSSENGELLLLGNKQIYRTQITQTGLDIKSEDKIKRSEIVKIREAIGRIGMFDLDGDSTQELLLGVPSSDECRYYVKEDNSYQLAGPLPGFPIDFNQYGYLLVGQIDEGYNLFNPLRTNLIKVSSEGFGGQKSLANLKGAFLEAEIIDSGNDGKVEIAVLYPNSILTIVDPDDTKAVPQAEISNVGLGLCNDGKGGFYASSTDSSSDRVVRYTVRENQIMRISESPVVPYHIYRIGLFQDKIIALAVDDSDNYMLIVFTEFR